jgi:hypothetical protein
VAATLMAHGGPHGPPPGGRRQGPGRGSTWRHWTDRTIPAGRGDPEAQEESDKLRRRVLWTMPSGLYVVGSRDGDRRNLMTLN